MVAAMDGTERMDRMFVYSDMKPPTPAYASRCLLLHRLPHELFHGASFRTGPRFAVGYTLGHDRHSAMGLPGDALPIPPTIQSQVFDIPCVRHRQDDGG